MPWKGFEGFVHDNSHPQAISLIRRKKNLIVESASRRTIRRMMHWVNETCEWSLCAHCGEWPEAALHNFVWWEFAWDMVFIKDLSGISLKSFSLLKVHKFSHEARYQSSGRFIKNILVLRSIVITHNFPSFIGFLFQLISLTTWAVKVINNVSARQTPGSSRDLSKQTVSHQQFLWWESN